MEDCLPWEWSHEGSREKTTLSEEKAAAEITCDKLTPPFLISLTVGGGGGPGGRECCGTGV